MPPPLLLWRPLLQAPPLLLLLLLLLLRALHQVLSPLLLLDKRRPRHHRGRHCGASGFPNRLRPGGHPAHSALKARSAPGCLVLALSLHVLPDML